jgi:hypothetical protein
MGDSDERVTIDLPLVFAAAPGRFLLLAPDRPQFTILAVTEAYLRATMTRRSEILGRGLFEVFPDNPVSAVVVLCNLHWSARARLLMRAAWQGDALWLPSR